MPEITLTTSELQALTAFSIECASKVLPLFERDMPGDTRPRDAIDAATAFAQSGKRSNELRTKGLAAYKASRTATTPVAVQVAESATQAVGAAYLHPLFDARQVKHILGSASHAAYALELEGSSEEASVEYQSWVIQRAPMEVIAVLQRYPATKEGRGRTTALLHLLDEALRHRKS